MRAKCWANSWKGQRSVSEKMVQENYFGVHFRSYQTLGGMLTKILRDNKQDDRKGGFKP